MEIVITDGGRAEAGLKKTDRDCVVRAIAIATGKPYKEVYDELTERTFQFYDTSRSKRIRRGKSIEQNGVYKDVYHKYLEELGWVWTPLMKIGSGCTVHLREDELPSGTIIASLSKHLATVVDGVLHDSHDSSRGGTRCVYGYYRKASKS